jgi:hypothetical protein
MHSWSVHLCVMVLFHRSPSLQKYSIVSRQSSEETHSQSGSVVVVVELEVVVEVVVVVEDVVVVTHCC